MGLFGKKDKVDALQSKGDVNSLIKMLNSKDTGKRYNATLALGEIGDIKAVPYLVKALQDTHPPVREAAVQSLTKVADKSAVPALVKTLRAKRWTMREKAAQALGKIGSEEAVMPLAEALKDDHEVVRVAALKAFVDIGSDKAVDTLIETIKGKRDRFHAVFALSKIGAKSKNAVPDLIDIVQDKQAKARDIAVYAIKSIGPEAGDAIPVLKSLIDDPDEDWDMKYNAMEAIANIEGKTNFTAEDLLKKELEGLSTEDRVIELANRAYHVSHTRKGYTIEGTPSYRWVKLCRDILLSMKDDVQNMGGQEQMDAMFQSIHAKSDIAARYLRAMWQETQQK